MGPMLAQWTSLPGRLWYSLCRIGKSQGDICPLSLPFKCGEEYYLVKYACFLEIFSTEKADAMLDVFIKYYNPTGGFVCHIWLSNCNSGPSLPVFSGYEPKSDKINVSFINRAYVRLLLLLLLFIFFLFVVAFVGVLCKSCIKDWYVSYPICCTN